MASEIVYSRKEAEIIRDKNLHLIGKHIYPESLIDKYEELNLATIEYIEIMPTDKNTFERCLKIYEITGQWFSDSINWEGLKDEYMIWVASNSNGTFMREVNEFINFNSRSSTGYQKLN